MPQASAQPSARVAPGERLTDANVDVLVALAKERDEPFRTWWPPDDRPSLPLMYSLVARRPG